MIRRDPTSSPRLDTCPWSAKSPTGVFRLEWAVIGDLLARRLGGADLHPMMGQRAVDIAKLLAK